MATQLWRQLEEVDNQISATLEEGRRPKEPERSGYASGIPIGGATDNNQGGNSLADTSHDRQSAMQELLQAYLACPWSSAAIDVIARTCTAGGVSVVPLSNPYGNGMTIAAPPGVKKVQELLRYINPTDDIRQLMRGIITDLLIFGDSFTEVVWVMGEPVALYPLDPSTMSVLADEHGMITGYVQTTQTNLKASFKPKEVIHIKFDTPGDALYGTSPTQKAILPITAWLFTAGLLKETMKKGDPGRIWVDWPQALPETERNRFTQQFQVRNLGAKNIGNPFETKGGANVKELGVNNIMHWLDAKVQLRDEILSEYGVPPAKVGVIEAGNIGGGTGTSQDKHFRVNTCGPIQELVLEKFSFALLYQVYGITDWYLKFGIVDWRDDEVIEVIRDQRIRNGTWTLNKARADIGEPPVEGGDDPILVDRQNMVLWQDLGPLSKANLAAQLLASLLANPQGRQPVTQSARQPMAPQRRVAMPQRRPRHQRNTKSCRV